MQAEAIEVGVRKGLEEWLLQNAVDGAIVASFIALALIAGRFYLVQLRQLLSLRVAIEAWEFVIELLTDLSLLFAALVGLLSTNPDIFEDAKVALPFCPLAFILCGAALVIRTMHGGRIFKSPAFWLSATLILLSALLNWFGFTFVMESAGEEWIAEHNAQTWAALRAMRSTENPELAMATFYWAQPAMFAVFLWGVIAGLVKLARLKPAQYEAGDEGVGAGEDE